MDRRGRQGRKDSKFSAQAPVCCTEQPHDAGILFGPSTEELFSEPQPKLLDILTEFNVCPFREHLVFRNS